MSPSRVRLPLRVVSPLTVKFPSIILSSAFKASSASSTVVAVSPLAVIGILSVLFCFLRLRAPKAPSTVVAVVSSTITGEVNSLSCFLFSKLSTTLLIVLYNSLIAETRLFFATVKSVERLPICVVLAFTAFNNSVPESAFMAPVSPELGLKVHAPNTGEKYITPSSPSSGITSTITSCAPVPLPFGDVFK